MAKRPAVHAPGWPSPMYRALPQAATCPGQTNAGSAAREPQPALSFETAPPSEGAEALPPTPAPAETTATRCQPLGLGTEEAVGAGLLPLSCQANGSDSCCGGPVRDPAQETHAVLSPTSSRPLASERRRGSAMHHPSCIIDQLPVSHDTARAPRIQSLAGGSAGIFPAPVTVQMRKLRESRSHNGLGGRAGRRVQASRDPVPGSVPSHTPLIQRGDSDTHPHRGRGSGVPRRGPVWGRRIKVAQRPPRLSLFLLCPLRAQPALRAGEAGKGAPSRKQGPARGAPGSTRRRVT